MKNISTNFRIKNIKVSEKFQRISEKIFMNTLYTNKIAYLWFSSAYKQGFCLTQIIKRCKINFKNNAKQIFREDMQ